MKQRRLDITKKAVAGAITTMMIQSLPVNIFANEEVDKNSENKPIELKRTEENSNDVSQQSAKEDNKDELSKENTKHLKI